MARIEHFNKAIEYMNLAIKEVQADGCMCKFDDGDKFECDNCLMVQDMKVVRSFLEKDKNKKNGVMGF